MIPGRVGSVGGEVLKRFHLVFDYDGRVLYLKKNRDYSHFNYNKSGVEIRHNGLQWVQETVHLETTPLSGATSGSGDTKISNDFKYKFQLKPIYEIANIRKNSSAAKSGLQVGDIVITFNRRPIYRYSLEEINSLFKSEEENTITLEVERNSQILKFTFQLVDVL
jgi:S1-C subfamily serine protease